MTQNVQALAAMLAKLSPAEKADLARQAGLVKTAKLSVKATGKGGISVYGLARFPVTMYTSQWQQVFGAEVKLLVEGCMAEANANAHRYETDPAYKAAVDKAAAEAKAKAAKADKPGF